MYDGNGELKRLPPEEAAAQGARAAVLAAVQRRGMALADAPEALRDDRAVVLAAVGRSGGALQYASQRLRDDRAVVLAAVRQYGPAIRYASERLRGDEEVALAAIAQYSAVQTGWHMERGTLRFREKAPLLSCLDPALLRSRDFFQKAAQVSWEILRDAPDEILQDAAFLRPWLLREPALFPLAPEALRADCDLLLELMGQGLRFPDAFAGDIPPAVWARQDFVAQVLGRYPWRFSMLPLACRKNDALIRDVSRRWPPALADASEALRDDRAVLLAAVRQQGDALQYASDRLRDDRDLVLAAVRQQGDALQYASERLRDDPEVAAAALAASRDGGCYRFFSPALRDNQALLHRAMALDPRLIRYASDRLRQDAALAYAQPLAFYDAQSEPRQAELLRYFTHKPQRLKALFAAPWSRRSIPAALRTDEAFLCAFACAHPSLLRRCPQEFRANAALLKTVLARHGGAWLWIDPKLQQEDRGLALLAATGCGAMLRYFPPVWREDREIVLAAVGQWGLAIRYAAEPLRRDRAVILAAVRRDGRVLALLPEALRADREIVQAAVSQKGGMLRYAAAALRADRETVQISVTRCGRALEYAAAALRADPALRRLAAARCPRAARDASAP